MRRTSALAALLCILSASCAPATLDVPPTAQNTARQMAETARAFLASLTPEQAQAAQFAMTDDTVRTHWSNLPAMFVERGGVRLGDLDDGQRRGFHRLLRASSSSQGYQKLAGIIRLDDVLHEEAAGAVARGERRLPPELITSWTSDNYWISVFGEPGDVRWAWQLSGHHLAANFTIVDNKLSFTPLFLGAEPNEVRTGTEAGWRVLSHEGNRGFELMQALSDDQRERAIIAPQVPDDILAGPGRKGSLTAAVGIEASDLDPGQQALLWALIGEFVANVDGDAAAAQFSRIMGDGLDNLRFAWTGPWDDEYGRYYYRVHGPSVLIEYVVEEAVGGVPANHVHSIIRDPGNDYGEDWLGRHYAEDHALGQ